MVQQALSFSAVAAAALYVGWRFMPAALRRWLAAPIGVALRRRGFAPERIVRLEAKLNGSGACGNCSSCNACAVGKRAI